MASFNQLTITGHLGRDPELSVTPTGLQVTRFSIAANNWIPGRAGGEGTEETMWLNVTIFGQLAEHFERKAHKGDLVLLSGKFWPRKYTARDGSAAVSYDLTANTGQILATGLPHGKQETSKEDTGDPFLPDFPD